MAGDTSSEGMERRRRPRISTDLRCRFRLQGGAQLARVADISEGGAFLVTDCKTRRGQELPLVIQLGTSGGTVRSKAVVRWVSDGSGEQPVGVGVDFVGMPEADRFALLAFLAGTSDERAEVAQAGDDGRKKLILGALAVALILVVMALAM